MTETQKVSDEIERILLSVEAAVGEGKTKEIAKCEAEFNKISERVLQIVNSHKIPISKFNIAHFIVNPAQPREATDPTQKSLANLLLIERLYRLRPTSPDFNVPVYLWKTYMKLFEHLRARPKELPFSWQFSILENFVRQYVNAQRQKLNAVSEARLDESKRAKSDLMWGYNEVLAQLMKIKRLENQESTSLPLAAKCALVRLYTCTGNYWQSVSQGREIMKCRSSVCSLGRILSSNSQFCYHFGFSLFVLRNYRESYDVFSRVIHGQSRPQKELNHCVVLCSLLLGRSFVDDHVLEKLSDLSYRLLNSETPEAVADLYKEALSKAFPSTVSPISLTESDEVIAKGNPSSIEHDWRFNRILKDVLRCASASHVRSFAVLYNRMAVKKCSILTSLDVDYCRRQIMFDCLRRAGERRRTGRDQKTLLINVDQIVCVASEDPDTLLASALSQFIETK